MYKVDIPLDTKESAAIERRRNMEMARKSRIFDAKDRTIGVDLNGIAAQVTERKNSEADEQRRHDAYASLLIRNDKTAQLLDARNQRMQDQIARDMVDFRAREQPPHTRREYDLNEPEYIKNSGPLGQDDHGISALQSFVGEDVYNGDRNKHQKEQIREWSLQLQAERRAAEEEASLQDRIYDLKRIDLDNKAMKLENDELAEKAATVNATKEFNQRLAEEQRLAREAQRNQDLADNTQEIRNQILGDTLTENPNVARSAFGAHRVIPDRWKGMSEDQLFDVRNVQERQRLENIKKNEQQQELHKEWSLQQTSTAKAGILMDREQSRQQVTMRKQLDLENAELARQQSQQKNHLDQEVYTNVPSQAYYAQFNTTSR